MLSQRSTRIFGARVSGALRGTVSDDSKGFVADSSRLPTVLTLRLVLALTGLAGALLLLVASFTNVIVITVGTTSRVLDADTAQTGWDRHGPALVLLGLLALFLLWAALRGSRVAMAGLLVAGIVALAIPTKWDRPHIHEVGSIGDIYASATADPGTGYYLETLGGALLLLSGGALLVLGRTPLTRRAAGDDDVPGSSPEPGGSAASAAERSRARRAARAE
jgi:hypothetical protein